MARIFLGLGTNLGDRRSNLVAAQFSLSERVGEIIRSSDNYESAPWGFHSDHYFLNNVVEMTTTLSPVELLAATQAIEKLLGRTVKSSHGYTDRIIDIDILFYDDQIIDLPELKIPHPFILERDFVYIPLCQIAPNLVHPVTGQPIKERLQKK